jgi:hypothetical protein
MISMTVLKTALLKQNITRGSTIKMPLPYHNRIVKDRRNYALLAPGEFAGG